jgi:nucleoside phosphorylase
MIRRHDLFLDAFSPDYRRYFDLFQPRERVKEPLTGEVLAHYEWLADVLYAGALLAKSSVFVPHAFVLQCPLLSRLVERNRLLVRESLLRMPMGDADVGESLEKMRRTYPRREFPRLFTPDAETIVAAVSEATIRRLSKLGNGIVRIVEQLPDTLENGRNRWEGVSTRDIGRIVRGVRLTFNRGAPITYGAVLDNSGSLPPIIRRLIFSSVHYAYGVQHVREYDLAILRDIPGIHDHFGIDNNCVAYSYRRFWSLFGQLGLNRTFLRTSGPEGIILLRAKAGCALIVDLFAKALRARTLRNNWRVSVTIHPAESAHQIERLWHRQIQLLGHINPSGNVYRRRALSILEDLSDVWTVIASAHALEDIRQDHPREPEYRIPTDQRRSRLSIPTLQRKSVACETGTPRVALLTVIGPELEAVKRAFAISEEARMPGRGRLHYEVVKETSFNGPIRLEVHCIARPGNSASSAAAARIIQRGHKFLLLCGIAAGWREKLKIGDVVVPRSVVDTTLKVAEGGVLLPRPSIVSPLLGVLQMNSAAAVDKPQWEALFEKTCRGWAIPPEGGYQRYETDVADVPSLYESAILSDNLLVRDPNIIVDAANELHQQIRAAEMEAAGFVSACNDEYPPVPWFVIRGISDFGDQVKNDYFHKLAASAVASYASLYLENVLDLRIWRE